MMTRILYVISGPVRKKADADKGTGYRVQGTAADIVKRRAARRTRKLVPVRSLQSFWWRG